MVRYVYPVVCANDRCVDVLGQRTVTTSDMMEEWSWTVDKLFSYAGVEAALCPNCTLRFANRVQLRPAVSYRGGRTPPPARE